MSRRAKIVCTLGPATFAPDRIRALVDAGMDVARLNLSHGSHEQHAAAFAAIRAAAEETGRNIGILVDLQGPKIRLGNFAEGAVRLENGASFTISTADDVPGDVNRVGTTYKGLANDVHVGNQILIDDGRVVLTVVANDGTEIDCVVLVGGVVSDHKGLNLPNVEVGIPAMSEKDVDDLRWGLRLGADVIALSFVQRPEDVDVVHDIMAEEGVYLPVLAKIEKPQAIGRMDEILEAFDGIMVARGDLGVECPLEEVPILQKQLITKAREAAKPVIVATQMLESMITNPRPTRAEASDVANAVLDGADAVMLSGETSVGEYAIESVETMARIILATEAHALEGLAPLHSLPRTVSATVCRAATTAAASMGAKYLVAFTESGDTARRLARHRSLVPMLTFTPLPKVRAQLSLAWGMETFVVAPAAHTDEAVANLDGVLIDKGFCKPGDSIVIVNGTLGRSGGTNSMRFHRVSED
ncbi:MAG: pyruvate kinase [Frankiaceae bacterium]|nr:pyruvate kinase [Frankiaceae bacterium]MDQ1715926.1 pyruvate kinase [Frankiaceae bacterium]